MVAVDCFTYEYWHFVLAMRLLCVLKLIVQREVGRVEPAGAGGPAADQRHHGVPGGRPVRRRGRGRAAVAGARRRSRRRGGARACAPHAAVIDHSTVPPAAPSDAHAHPPKTGRGRGRSGRVT